MNDEIATSRDAARQLNSTFYQGRPCNHGHDGVRYTHNKNCIHCARQRISMWREDNSEHIKEYHSKYLTDNPVKNRIKQSKRRASVLGATPPWADLEAIAAVYASCPEGYHVDHIIPLKGKNVCGLHVSWNLQHLLGVENLKKGNRL